MSQFFQIHPDNPQKRLIDQATQIIRNGGVLSSRGRVIVDERTNTLIISDIPKRVEPIDTLSPPKLGSMASGSTKGSRVATPWGAGPSRLP